MRLHFTQHEQFRREGYLFLPRLFTPAEVRVLRQASLARTGRTGGTGGPVVPGADSPLARLARHPRLVRPAQALVGRRLCLHRLQVGGEAAAHDDGWPPQAHACGDAEAAGAVNLAVFLDESHEGQAPWMFIPGSHRRSGLEAYRDLAAAGSCSYPSWTLDYPLIGRVMARAGRRRDSIAAPWGPAGSMILFDARLLPAPGGGGLPAGSTGIYLSLVPVDLAMPWGTAGVPAQRPIACLADDCLLHSDAAGVPVPTGRLTRQRWHVSPAPVSGGAPTGVPPSAS
jgi:ectoine hydroxylase